MEASFSYNDREVSGLPTERLGRMSVQEATVDEICSTLRALSEDQLDQVLRFLHDLEQERKPNSTPADESMAPLYRVYTAAVRTGISDLAHKHDHYLYRVDKHDA